jgi:hypothetical protein
VINKFKKFRKNIGEDRLAIIVLIIFSLIAYWRWFFDFDVLLFTDWSFRFRETLLETSLLPQAWISNLNLGNISQMPFTYPIEVTKSFLASAGFSWNLIERILFMCPVAIMAPIGSFLLIKKVTNSTAGAFIGALFFSFNNYFLAAFQSGHMNLMVAYSLAPLFLFLILESYETRSFRNIIFLSFTGFTIGAYDFRIFFSLAWISFFYFIFYVLTQRNYGNKNIIGAAFIFFAPIFIVLLLNSFWLVPFFFSKGSYVIEAISRGVTQNNFTILNSITLGYPIREVGMIDFNFRYVPIYLWVIPIAGFLGLFFNRKKKLVLFFGCIALLGIFLGKQNADPFPNVYFWLFDHIPGFSGFRDASKHYYIIAIGYAVLVGAFTSWMLEKRADLKIKNYLKYLSIALIIFVSIWNTRLMINGKAESLFVPKKIPADYAILKKFLAKQPDYFFTLWVPNPSHWALFTNQHPTAGLDSLVQDWTWRDNVSQNFRNGNNPILDELTNVLHRPYSAQLLKNSSFKYIIIFLDDKERSEQYYNLFDLYGSREFFIENLDNLDYLRKIDIGTKDLVVYENKNFKPLLYTTNEKETIYDNIRFQPVKYNFIDSTEYNISIENISRPIYLNFAQTYHPEWKMRAGDFIWIKTLMGEKYFLPDENHYKNTANLNSYFIDPKETCQSNTSCQQNPDGSYNIKLTLFFKPQSYFYLGLIISGLTLAGLLGYLGYDIVKRKRKKNEENIRKTL